MDDCKPNLVCRSQEVLISTAIITSQKTQIQKCCCNYNKNLVPSNSTMTLVIAPNCEYDKLGSVNRWSVVSAGPDLKCLEMDDLMTYNVSGGNE